jgi:Rieske Fe-S protein
MPPSDPISPSRRRALASFVNLALTILGASLAAVLGAFARPSTARGRDGRWVRAGSSAELVAGVPVARVLGVPRVDGWYRERVRQTVFLLLEPGGGVRAMSATCTHLGCQVRWDGASRQFHCPCHGGSYAADGRVLSGPPPRPLDAIDVRLNPDDGSVMVRV